MHTKMNKVFAYSDNYYRESLPNIASIKFPDEQTSFSSRNETTAYEDKASSISPTEEEQQQAISKKFNHRSLYSIKCILIVLMVSLVLITALLLSTIWIACFSSSVSKLSADLLREQIHKVINFTDETVDKVLIVSETTKNVVWQTFEY